MGIVSRVTGGALSSLGRKVAPQYTSGFVRSLLERAIDGAGPLPGAAKAADRQLREADGDVEAAIRESIDGHVKLAGAQGFATNLGGIITAVAAIPANIAGLALIQCHLVAGVAYLRGYDLAEPRVRDAVLIALLGRSTVQDLVKNGEISGSPHEIATSGRHDPLADDRIGQLITAELIAGVGGKRMATFVGKRIPLVGGAVGGAADGYTTWQLGRYITKEFRAVGGPGRSMITVDAEV